MNEILTSFFLLMLLKKRHLMLSYSRDKTRTNDMIFSKMNGQVKKALKWLWYTKCCLIFICQKTPQKTVNILYHKYPFNPGMPLTMYFSFCNKAQRVGFSLVCIFSRLYSMHHLMSWRAETRKQTHCNEHVCSPQELLKRAMLECDTGQETNKNSNKCLCACCHPLGNNTIIMSKKQMATIYNLAS